MASLPKIYGLFSTPKFELGNPPGWKSRLAQRRAEADVNESHLAAIGRLPCTLCVERKGVRPHYLSGGPATARPYNKPDAWTVPLCLGCRTRTSGVGPHGEERFFVAQGVNPYALAQGLKDKGGNVPRMAQVLLYYKLQAEGVAQKSNHLVPDSRPSAQYRQRGR